MNSKKVSYKNKVYKQARIISIILFSFITYSTLILLTDNFSGINEYILKTIVSVVLSLILILVLLILCLAFVNEMKETRKTIINKLMCIYIVLFVFFLAITLPVSKLGVNCILDFQYIFNPKRAIISNVESKNLDSIKFTKKYIEFNNDGNQYKMNITSNQSKYIYESNNESYTVEYLPNTSILISIK